MRLVEICGKLETQSTNVDDKIILKTYATTDFSLLPLELERLWNVACGRTGSVEHTIAISELARYVAILELYVEFADTCTLQTSTNPRTRRDVSLRDQYDLCAYMVRNGKLEIDISHTPIHFALRYIDQQYEQQEAKASNSSDMDRLEANRLEVSQLLAEWNDKAEVMCKEQLAIHSFFYEQYCCELRDIASFIVLYHKQMNTEKPFIRSDHSYDSIKPITLFQQLSIPDQLEIANGKWKIADLARRSDTYLVVLKLLFDCIIDRSLHTRHPYLVARYGNPFEITQHIVQQSDGDEKCVRILATNYSIVAEIGLPELTSKCLSLLNHSKRGMPSFSF